MKFYHCTEFFLIVVLFIRVFFLFCLNSRFLFRHLDLLIYFLVLFLNSLFNELEYDWSLINRLYNLILPVSLIVAILLDGFVKPAFALMIIGVFNIVFFIFYNTEILTVFYVVSIFLVISKAINMTRKSGRLLKASPIYFVLAIDLIFTLISFELSQFKVDWNLSKYINYVQSISLFVFFLDVILYHVYIRRFFAL